MLLANYFPNRYKVHILLPMCITVAVGVGLLQRAGIKRAESTFTDHRGAWRFGGLAFLGLPTAVFASPLVADLVTVFGGGPPRLRMKLGTLAASWVGTILILEWCHRSRRRLTVFLLFPVVAAFAWFVALRSAFSETTFWPTPDSPQASVTRLTVLLAATILSVAITIRSRSFGPPLPAGITVSAISYALLALVQLAPGYLTPHYSIRDTSRDLGRLLAGFPGIVATSGGDGLFRENTLPYATVWGRRWPPAPSDKPEVIVVVFAFFDPSGPSREGVLPDRRVSALCRSHVLPSAPHGRANQRSRPDRARLPPPAIVSRVSGYGRRDGGGPGSRPGGVRPHC